MEFRGKFFCLKFHPNKHWHCIAFIQMRILLYLTHTVVLLTTELRAKELLVVGMCSQKGAPFFLCPCPNLGNYDWLDASLLDFQGDYA